jgi:O-antigen/teichoic acid export membrane protein
MMMMSIAIALQPNIDALMLSKLAPASAIGWYAAARNFMSVLTAPAAILGTAVYPRLARAYPDLGRFRRELVAGLKPLTVLGALGAVGCFLFADLAVTIVYSKHKFEPAIPILQVFAPGLLLLFVDVPLGYAILAAGRSRAFAFAKLAAVLLGAALDWLLIPLFQARYGNGGLGVVLSFCLSELVMIAAAVIMIPRGAIGRETVLDMARALLAGAAALALVRALPAMHALLQLPLCVAFFAVGALVLGLVRREDLGVFQQLLRRGRPAAGGET